MRKKAAIGILLTLLLTNIALLTFNIQPVEATETIYIQADGSVSPSTAPIQRSGDIYTFTDNISDSIWVLRDNIVIDGAGYTLQGTASIVQGIRLAGRTNVTVQNTQIKNFQNGIVVSDFASNINIRGNTITNTNYGIRLMYSSSNSISGNNITNNEYNIRLEHSSNNSIAGNGITNYRGIYLYNSSNNSISGNGITNIYYGIWLDYSSSFNSISGNNITANNNSGIVLSASSNNNSIIGNNIANNGEGIAFVSSSNNRVYHNNFIDNLQQVYSLSSTNMWDDGYPSGGNYWSDYNGTDLHWGAGQNETGGDGIGDTPYVIDDNNQDHYPLMAPFNTFDAGTWNGVAYNVDVVSNSTVSDFQFDVDQKSVCFNVTGDDGTDGFCRVTIPKDLLWVEDGWTVLVGGEPVNYTIIPNQNYTYMYFAYNHSTQTVIIQGTHVIPEFPSSAILPLLMILTIFAVALVKKRLPRKPQT